MDVTARSPLLVAPWLATVGAIVYFGRKAAPLGIHDDPAYQFWFWLTALLLSVAIVSAGVAILGREFLRSSTLKFLRAWKWPRTVKRVEGIVLTTVVVFWLGAVPHMRYMVRTGSGGSPPFSKIQAEVMAFVFRPFLAHMSEEGAVWQVFALVSAFWLVVGFVVGVALTQVTRRIGLSPAGALIASAIVVQVVLVLLRTISPMYLPS